MTISISSSIKFLKTPIIFTPFPKIATFLKPQLLTPFPLLVTPSFKPISFQSLPTTPSPPPSFASSPSSSSSPSVPPPLEEIINLFQSAPDPRAKFQQLLHYAAKLPPLDEKYKTKENKVEGCVSQVWVRAYLDGNEGKVYYEADSDSVMTKGLAALLVFGLSGQGIGDVVRVSPDFVTLLGLQQTLSPSRNNGFVNMLRLMKLKAVKLGVEAEKETGFLRGEMGFGGFSEGLVDGEKRSGLDSGRDGNGEGSFDENVVNLEKRSGLDSGKDGNGEGSFDENVVNLEKSSGLDSGKDGNGEGSFDENVVNLEKSSGLDSGKDGNGEGSFDENVVNLEKSSGLDSGKDDNVVVGGVIREKSSSFDLGRDDNGGGSFDGVRENVVNGEKSSSFGLGRDDNGGDSVDGVSENVVNGENRPSFGSGGDGNGNGGRKERIREVLEKELKPVELEVEDVSYQHAGHAGVRGSDGETHFNLKVVSEEFQGKSLVKRHRIIYGLLQDELQTGLHALSITAKTPSEVAQSR